MVSLLVHGTQLGTFILEQKLSLEVPPNHLDYLLQPVWLSPGIPDSVGLEQSLNVCISNKFLDDFANHGLDQILIDFAITKQ